MTRLPRWARPLSRSGVDRSGGEPPRGRAARVKDAFGRVPWRRLGSGLGLLAVSLTGLALGLYLAAGTSVDVGPFRSTMAVTPSWYGDTEVVLPPLGSLQLDSHDGPARLMVRLDALDRARTEALITDPAGITAASRTAVDDVRAGVTRLVLRATAVAVLGAMLLSALVYRKMRRVAWAGGLALTIMAAAFGSAFGTFNPGALREPRYEGLLANAPSVLGNAQRIADRYDEYAAQLQKLVQNVGSLYATVQNLPVYSPEDNTLRVLHVSDLHLNPAAWGVIRTVVDNFHIDVVVDTGDITDWGSEPEKAFVASISLLKVPYVFVRGNHDSAVTQAAVAAQPNAIVLDNKVVKVAGLSIAGIGDPRFTPDKGMEPAGSGDSKQTVERVLDAGDRLADTIAKQRDEVVDLALVHDPLSAGPLAGYTPLVLAGHRHHREISKLGDDQTMLMVQGSSGGAGLRGLEGETPTPLAMSVLYFDDNRALMAYDDITVGGTGLAEVALSRHVVDDTPPGQAAAPGTPPRPTPSRTR
ncbi:metallophosphoesterase family protein [Catellatospora coxensis]|uniref:Membrane protein n=1 Tax=Catellatospora coxensis TaxID=310354 RepID=A0A8J3KW31_9ACTN|nr:metallophosphoesterase [Catellatospora coxensis]GIG07243.1 membrane protein [Catellatospora coxensis]